MESVQIKNLKAKYKSCAKSSGLLKDGQIKSYKHLSQIRMIGWHPMGNLQLMIHMRMGSWSTGRSAHTLKTQYQSKVKVILSILTAHFYMRIGDFKVSKIGVWIEKYWKDMWASAKASNELSRTI